MTITPPAIAKLLAALGAARLIPSDLAADRHTARVWHAALAEAHPGAVDADVTATAQRLLTTSEDFLTLPRVSRVLAEEARRRRDRALIPDPPLALTAGELAAWRSSYAAEIKARGGTRDTAYAAALEAVPRARAAGARPQLEQREAPQIVAALADRKRLTPPPEAHQAP